jgi:hypothetical protein
VSGRFGGGGLAAALVAILALLLVLLAPTAARAAAGTFYARGGSGTGGGTCALGDECSLPKAVEEANTAGDGSAIVLMPGPDFTPNKELTVIGKIDIGPQAGSPPATIVGHDGADVALRLREVAKIHDVDLVAGTGSAALRLWDSEAERVTATATSPGAAACEFEEFASLADSVCHATAGDALTAAGFDERIDNVDAIGGRNGIVVEGGSPLIDIFEAFDSIAVGGPGFSDLAAVTPDTERKTEILMHGSVYDSTNGGEHPNRAKITGPGLNGNLTAPAQFANEAAGDFHELVGSPTVDAGETYEKESTLDLDRNPRALTAHPVCGGPTAGPIDIGAYEYVPPPLDCSPPLLPAPPPPIASAKPPAPGTALKKAKIDADAGTASFAFGGSGAVTGFACELLRPHRRGAKAARPKCAGCKSPKTYRHLAPGHYTFKVEAQGPGGADATPARKGFTIR